MKKILFPVIGLALLSFSAVAKAQSKEASAQKGSACFEAVKSGESYEMTFSLSQEKPVTLRIVAVKVTYLPSGTVVYCLADGNLSKADEEAFLDGKKPSGRMAMQEMSPEGDAEPGSSLVEPRARIYVKYPRAIAEDTSVKVEFLVQKGGELVSMLMSTAQMTDNTNFGMRFYYSIRQ